LRRNRSAELQVTGPPRQFGLQTRPILPKAIRQQRVHFIQVRAVHQKVSEGLILLEQSR
jgi:hypothetical protein